MEAKKNNPAVETESINNLNMNNIIDFSSVCGEGTVAQTATVDQKVVNDLFNAFMTIPSEVVVKFRNEDGYLKMVVNMNHREKFFRSYETLADAKLVEVSTKPSKSLLIAITPCGHANNDSTTLY